MDFGSEDTKHMIRINDFRVLTMRDISEANLRGAG